ncbi:hypothetical protein [Lutimonas sp.]|uniref:hypothetical protein n=1 Tax=Lutimonas sp. TaxID=1872403 RepID=UPI003D9BA094
MKKLLTYLLALPLLLMSCQDNEFDSAPVQEKSASNSTKLTLMELTIDKSKLHKKNSNKNSDFATQIAALNEALLGHGIQIEKMELLGAEGAGRDVFFSNTGNKQLEADFVPNDPRNWWPSNPYLGEWTDGSLAYWMDGTEQGTTSGMSEDQTIKAFQSVMNTWGSINCSNGLVLSDQGITSPTDFGDVGIVQWIVTGGPQGNPNAQGYDGTAPGSIVHAGNLGAWFFDIIGGPGGGSNILGVTFTFIWVDANGPTDIDNNGKTDVFVREIYMNDGFNWKDAPDDVLFNDIYDYETVMLHEVGHGLSQGHFGKMFGTAANRKLHFAPYALMNAGYTIANREIIATDSGGHCSNWAEWPNN